MNTHFTDSLKELFARDLDKLHEEISSYPDEASLWKLNGQIKNTAGNLALHICGNLQHFVGAVLGQSGYQRNRDYEFAARNILRAGILQDIATTKEIVTKTLSVISTDVLAKPYPINVLGKELSTQHFLIHLYGHLTYHLGQVNYHRRLLC